MADSTSTARDRRSRRKASDPFFIAPAPGFVPTSPTPESGEGTRESLLNRIIVTPVLFVSFLISLALVNWRDRRWRARSHRTSSWVASFFSRSVVDPDPYQDPADTTWNRRDSAHDIGLQHIEPPGVLRNAQRSWHLHKKVGQIAKLEVSDAFELRSRVIGALMVSIIMVVVAVLYVAAWFLRHCWNWRETWRVLAGNNA